MHRFFGFFFKAKFLTESAIFLRFLGKYDILLREIPLFFLASSTETVKRPESLP